MPDAAEGSTDRARASLDEGRRDCHDKQRQGKPQGAPESIESREPGQQDDGQVPLGHQGQRPEPARPWLVKRLKRGMAPNTVIDPPSPAQQIHERLSVDPPGPGKMAESIVLLGPLAFQHRLGLAVPQLLLPVGA